MKLHLRQCVGVAIFAVVALGVCHLAQAQTATEVVKVTAPNDGQAVWGKVALRANVDQTVKHVTFYVDGNAYKSCKPDGAVSWNASKQSAGDHLISAIAYASDGSVLGSDQVHVEVNKPISITSPSADSTVSGLVDVTASAPSANTVDFYVDQSFVSSGPPLDYEWNSNNSAPGSHTVTAKAYNAAGALAGTDSINLTVQPATTSISAGTASSFSRKRKGSNVRISALASAAYNAGIVSDPSTQGPFVISTPGASLPSDSQCAAEISKSSWEPRPQNNTANHTPPTASQLSYFHAGSYNIPSNYIARVDGNFSGTTDEIIQWASCKWGFNPSVTRAIAAGESHWMESGAGDLTSDTKLCPPGAVWRSGKCSQSYGIVQIKYIYMPRTWPLSHTSTAFNLDYKLAEQRACYDGKIAYLHQRGAGYGGGSASYRLWGCVGEWFSGSWYDSGSKNYQESMKALYEERVWLRSYF
ncbi:MAG: Ig-like domain-containing protein [Candidatus Binataceae bacterium]